MTPQSLFPQTVRLAKDVMSTEAVPLTPGKFSRDLLVQFLSGRFDGWPVVDSTRTVIGVLRESRLLDEMTEAKLKPDLCVEDVMTTPPFWVAEDESLSVVLKKMVETQVLRLPVVSGGRLVGVISRSQAVRQYCGFSVSPGQVVSACVWCDRVRTSSEGSSGASGWQDAGILLSPDQFPLTHGELADTYCPACLKSLQGFIEKNSSALEHKAKKTVSPPCVLVVDDDLSVMAMLQEALMEWGYAVCRAGNGREGLRMATTRSVDGILLDLDMPIMTGRTMLDELRWLDCRVPVVMMSGGADHKELKQFLQEGAQGYLMKPFTLQALKQICEQLFPGKRMKQKSTYPLMVAG